MDSHFNATGPAGTKSMYGNLDKLVRYGRLSIVKVKKSPWRKQAALKFPYALGSFTDRHPQALLLEKLPHALLAGERGEER